MVTDLEAGTNPRRVIPRHRERGPKRFTYTWADIERATDKSRRTLQRWVKQGLFDPADFASVLQILESIQIRLIGRMKKLRAAHKRARAKQGGE